MGGGATPLNGDDNPEREQILCVESRLGLTGGAEVRTAPGASCCLTGNERERGSACVGTWRTTLVGTFSVAATDGRRCMGGVDLTAATRPKATERPAVSKDMERLPILPVTVLM